MIGSRSTYTRKRILDAATRLFAQKGDKTSLREITAEARVNLSSVSYHFGSKEGLIQAVYQQRLDSLNHEQLTRLERLEAQAGRAGALDPLKIVEAYFRPLLRHTLGEPSFFPVRECFANGPNALIRALAMNGHSEVLGRFYAALMKALPNTPESELQWRLLFMMGAASCAGADMNGLLLALNRSNSEPFDTELLTEHLMPFLAGGLLGPLSGTAHTDLGKMPDNVNPSSNAKPSGQWGRQPPRPE